MSAARTPRDAACSGRASPRALTAHTSGFTMLELLVVTAIIGMIAVLSPPMFSSSVASAEQRATARSVAQIMRLARSEAIAQRKDIAVEFDLAQRTYQIQGGKRSGKWPETIELQLTTTVAETVDEQHANVRFYADGGSTGGRVTLKYKEREYRIDIGWLTGRIAIDES
ncbi:MAG TPA: GspH/FimT family pseudopilin [Casimicrobium sp.]|nr:GspH/FimT family pseudopilin [Casimicrobium sp.]